MSYFRYEDKQIYYEESGEGSPLILLHGNTSCGKMFDPIVPVFAAKYRVIVPDFLGNGRSERIEKWPSDLWFDWAKQVKALCNHLGLKKVKLIGSSGGALAAINVALEYPELVESFIADSFEGLKADHEITEQIRNGRAQAKTFGGFVDYLKTLHGDDWEQVFDADMDAVLRHAEQIGEFLHKPIDELKVPMLLTGSLEDDMFPKDHCKVLFDEICAKTSLAKAHIFEHGGHPAILSNMDEFVDLIPVLQAIMFRRKIMREITSEEVSKLYDCIRELSEYHNTKSVNFKGLYPLKPYEKTLESFEEALRNNESYIAVAEIENQVIGFCKVDINGENGKLDYLVVKEEFRGKGFGKELMDWAMLMFDKNNVRHIEVKVIDGNPTIHLYEKYGFRMKSLILGIERSIRI